MEEKRRNTIIKKTKTVKVIIEKLIPARSPLQIKFLNF